MSGWNSNGWDHRGHGYRPRHMGGRGMPGIPLVGILMLIGLVIFFSVGLKFGWIFFIVLPFFWMFKSGAKSYGGWRGGEWSHDSSVDEKRKNDDLEEKPKSAPTYVGDDGELTDKPKRAAGDDIYYI